MSEELTASLATNYCSDSALAVSYRKNLGDKELSLEMSGMLMVWNISGPRSPSNYSAAVCSSCMKGKQRLSPQAAVPVSPQTTTSAKRGSPSFPAIYSCILLLSSLLLMLEFCSENWFGQKLIISLTCLATSSEW